MEPIVGFWEGMGQLARSTASALESVYPTNHNVLSNQPTFLRHFAQRMDQLRTLAGKELDQVPFTDEENRFVNDLIEYWGTYDGFRTFSGWYPALFYKPYWDDYYPFHKSSGADKWDALITDVHSDPEDDYSPGHILHEAVGNVHLMMIAVNNGPDRMVYAGPVLSHYEFCEPFPIRRTDGEWKERVRAKNLPPSPEWTSDYLVPDPIDLPSSVW